MATIEYTLNTAVGKAPRIVWEDMLQDDTGLQFPLTDYDGLAASVEVGGTFGGATVTLKVSNTGTFHQAKDTNGLNISFTAGGFAEFSTAALLVRPEVSGGNGTTDIFVVMTVRG
jgi:hypothetical protein